jgi:predicted amidohydrolase
MDSNELKLTIFQQPLVWESEAENLENFNKLISGLNQETDVLILPEVFSTGFSMDAKKLAVPMDGIAVKWMQKWANEKGVAVCGSLMIKEEGKFYNRFLWVEPNGKIITYDKAHLFRMGEEHAQFEAGNKQVLISYKGWQIAPFVCYDLRFPVWLRKTPQFNYDLSIVVANWPQKRAAHWKALGIARAIENQAYFAFVNRVGEDGLGIYHSGDSQLISPLGEVVWSLADEASVQTLTISKSALIEYRKSFPANLDADIFEIK